MFNELFGLNMTFSYCEY